MDQREYMRLRKKKEEEYLPYSVFFQIRVILALVLLVCFACAEKRLLTEEQKQEVYSAMAQSVSPDSWEGMLHVEKVFPDFIEFFEKEY